MIIIRMSLPLVTTSRAGVTPIAIIPPSGKSLLPGRTMASNSIIGANTLAAAQISARPAKKGQSKPILSVRPFNLFEAKSVIPWDKGSTAAINQVPIKENSSKQTAAVKDREKFAWVFGQLKDPQKSLSKSQWQILIPKSQFYYSIWQRQNRICLTKEKAYQKFYQNHNDWVHHIVHMCGSHRIGIWGVK